MRDEDDRTEIARLRARIAELEGLNGDGGRKIAGPMADPATLPTEADILFAAAEKTRMPMIVTDPHQPDNPIVFANRAFQALSGYPASELLGRNCRFLQGPDTAPEDVARIRAGIAARRDVVVDIVNYRRDGTPFINELYISPVFDRAGDLRYFFGSQVDLTHYREDALALKQNEEKYRSLFEAIDAGFCVLQLRYDAGGAPVDYVFLEANRAFEVQSGLADPVGKSVRALVPELEQHWFDTYARVDRDRKGCRFESESVPMQRVFDVHAYPVGRPSEHSVAVLFNDITARKQAEARLHSLNETLEHQVRTRTEELMASEEALRQSQKMEAIGQLTGGVAHDFNNLLTIISSAADFLRRDDLAEDRRRRYVTAIVDTAARATKLTGQLLAFARRQPLQAETFDVTARVAGIVDLVRTLVGSGVEIHVVPCVDRGPCLVEADPGQFETALVNLSVNARDAMEGRGTIRIGAEPVDAIPPLRQHGAIPGDFVAIAVTDTGPGIDPDIAERIFEPFFTTKDVGKGTGLGLSQVFGFAKQSGGDIAVTSGPDGSTFTLYLPARRAGAQTASSTGEDAGAARDARVLVVEDNVDVGRFSTELLQDLGYRTTWVSDARAALDLLATDPAFDLVFSDVVMPGMNGVELGLEVRRRHPGLPVLLTSGYSTVLVEQGTHGFDLVRKPYSSEMIAAAFARALNPDAAA